MLSSWLLVLCMYVYMVTINLLEYSTQCADVPTLRHFNGRHIEMMQRLLMADLILAASVCWLTVTLRSTDEREHLVVIYNRVLK